MSSPRSPRELHRALASAFNHRDLDEILALYKDDATLVPQPGEAVTGTAQLRQALAGFLAVTGKMQIDTQYVIEAGPLALTASSWSIVEGQETKIAAHGVELMSREPDGTWRFLIDHPFGADRKSW